MKVALFSETYLPHVNGIVTHVKTLKYGLEKLGHEVLVVTADKHAKHHYVEDGILHCPSVAMKRFYGFGVASPLSNKRLRLIADFDPDIIHIHNEFGIGISGIMAAKAQKKPLVYTLHTMYDQYIYYIAPRMFTKVATKFSHHYEKFIANRANALTGPSLKCDEYFKKIGVDKDMSLIPNSADLDAFDPKHITQEQKDAFREKFGIARDLTLACFAGRLGKEKSVDVLLEFWAQTIKKDEGLHLVIIGDGPDRQALEELARELGIAEMVTFTGMVKHTDMPAYYASCDMYVTASLSEMNSFSMLEGMATGLPVLQRYDELNADQIQTGVNGYLFHSKEEMAEKLRSIRSSSPEKLAQIKKLVISSVKDRGSTDLANYMLGVYEKAIDEKVQVPVASRYHP